MKPLEEKILTVLHKNTYYFFNSEFEQIYEANTVHALANLLLVVQARVLREGIHKEIFIDLLQKPNGLKALLALNGFSNESLKRLLTYVRIIDDRGLSMMLKKDNWDESSDLSKIKEWGDTKIEKLVTRNEHFRIGLVNLFFEGASLPNLARVLPPFELRKLSIDKLSFRTEPMIDTLVRYKEKGSYSGMKQNNPESVVHGILANMGVTYETGDLNRLIDQYSDNKRTMDFIIPDQENPKIIAESSFLVTTSSGQGDKSKTEISIRNLINEQYPGALFVGFVDGIGWYARQTDLRRMVTAYDDVFTFHPDELQRFAELLINTFQ